MNLDTNPSRRLDRKWWIFGVIAVGSLVTVVDQTGVNLALPRISERFGATIPAVQWVALGYILTTGMLLLPMGRLSDMVGRKLVYTAGFVIFTAGAVLSGSSTALFGLILFRALQGIGSAMVQANAMAIVTSTFPSSERGKAIGLFITTIGIGAIAGPIVGGAVVSLLSWRFVFFLAVPLGLVSIVSALLVLEGGLSAGADRAAGRFRFDWIGALLSATALAMFLLVMTNAYRLGWTSPYVLLAFLGVALLFVAFIKWELRISDPMLAMELFKSRLFSLGTLASFLAFIAGTSLFFLMPFYLQGVLNYTPGRAGLLLAPGALCFALSGPISGRLSDRFGWRRLEVIGLVTHGAALVVASRFNDTSPAILVVVVVAMQGVAMGTFFSPNASAVLSTVRTARYGIATAFLNMTRNAAHVTGVGLVTAIVTAVMASSGYEPSLDVLAEPGGDIGVKTAFTDGLRVALLLLTGLVAVAIGLSIFKGGGFSDEDAVIGADRRLPSKA